MKSRILIIEDNLELAENLREILELEADDLEIELAGDGKQGLEALARSRFDLVLTDMRMPGVSGSEVVREVRRLYPDLPAVVMTAYAEDDSLSAAKDWGAMDVLIKPIDVEQLLGTLKRFIAPSTRILIVEDDQQLRTLLGNYLSRFNGVIVTPASDLASALHLSANVSFDAAILDVNLPDGMTISSTSLSRRSSATSRSSTSPATATGPSPALRGCAPPPSSANPSAPTSSSRP